jgi:hypothetical protein
LDTKSQLTSIVSKHLGWPTDAKSLEKNHALIWLNPRKKDAGGMRLSEQGYEVLKGQMEMKSYDIEFPKDLTLTNQTMIWLDRFIDSPWYITKKSITVFKEKTAVQLVLFSGDVQKFGLAKAMSLKSHIDGTEQNTD